MYDPMISPLELPVQRWTADCRSARPLAFPPRPGATPGTTLAGAFSTALSRIGCRQTADGPCCLDRNDHPSTSCQQPDACPAPLLCKPYSQVQRRALPQPIFLHAPRLEENLPVETFELELTLWGRRAVQHAALIEAALETMGQEGLIHQGQSIRFSIDRLEQNPPRTLAERLATADADRWQRVLLEFATPFLHYDEANEPPAVSGRRKSYFAGDGPLPFVRILENCAFELAVWDLEDRDFGPDLPKDLRDALTQATRQGVRERASRLTLLRSDLVPAQLGLRRSRHNQNCYPLEGFVGVAELGGRLTPVAPWLLALWLGGGGGRRAVGFGRVNLWQQTDAAQ